MAQAKAKRPREHDEQALPPYSMVLQWDPDDAIFVVTVPELPGCRTHGKTYDKAVKKGQAAIRSWLHAADHWGTPIPAPQTRSYAADTVVMPDLQALGQFAAHIARLTPEPEAMPPELLEELRPLIEGAVDKSEDERVALFIGQTLGGELPPDARAWMDAGIARAMIAYLQMVGLMPASPDASEKLEFPTSMRRGPRDVSAPDMDEVKRQAGAAGSRRGPREE